MYDHYNKTIRISAIKIFELEYINFSIVNELKYFYSDLQYETTSVEDLIYEKGLLLKHLRNIFCLRKVTTIVVYV